MMCPFEKYRTNPIAIVIAIVAGFAIGFFYYGYNDPNKINNELSLFHYSGLSNGRVMVEPIKVVKLLGLKDAMGFFEFISKKYNIFGFDGDSRFIQIRRDWCSYAYENNPPIHSDGIFLFLIVREKGKFLPSVSWCGPPGTYIDNASIIEEGVIVKYRILEDPNNPCRNNDMQQQTDFIEWKPFTAPKPGNFGDSNLFDLRNKYK